jgi:enoyl-CoA hydratase/carnithine racemase
MPKTSPTNTSQPSFIFEKFNDLGLLTINIPPQNFIPVPDFIDVEKLDTWVVQNKLKGIIIQGAGRHFSAGADLKKLHELASDEYQLMNRITKGKELLDYISNLNIPVIAAIKGSCFGAGLEIALACHIRICTSNVLFAFPEINQNIMPGLAGTVRLPNLAGFSNATGIILSGDIFDAQTALKIKLVDHLSEDKDIASFAIRLMKKMTDHRLLEVIQSIMTSLNNARKLPYEQALNEETRLFCKLAIAEAKRNIKN